MAEYFNAKIKLFNANLRVVTYIINTFLFIIEDNRENILKEWIKIHGE